MKTPISNPTTRESLVTTAAYNTRWFASLVAGTAVLGSTAVAVDNNWTGAIDTDWNNGLNWSDPHGFGSPHVPTKDNGHPGDEDAVINVTTDFPIVVANTGGPPRDIKVGLGGGQNGRLDVRSGIAAAGGGNWFFVGCIGGATGVMNIADTSVGTEPFFGLGSGGISVPGGRLWVGGTSFDAGGGNGTVNVNTTGTLAIGNDLALGTAGATGVMNVNSGTITTGGWNFFGKNENGQGGTGTLNMSGGTLTNTGRTYVGQEGCTGAIHLTGGDYLNVNNEQFIVGENANSNGDLTVSHADSLLQVGGELWLGQGGGGNGSLTISLGAVTIGNWFAIGRSGATGTLDLSGGSVTKTGGGDTILGSDGSGGSGTITQDGGTLTLNNIMKIGASGGSTGLWTLNAGIANINNLIVGDGGDGTADFNGGTLTVRKISGGGGADVVNFDGTSVIVGAAPVGAFMENLDDATIGAAGLPINTNGFSVTASAALKGSGGVTKTGAGTLAMTGANTYTGANIVTAGKLLTNTSATGVGDFTVADDAGMGVVQVVQDEQVTIGNIEMGTAGDTSIDIDLGNFTGITTAAPLDVTNLSLAGTVTINIADAFPAIGMVPLISYANLTGSPDQFVLGTLPLGVQATLDTSVSGLVRLNVTNASLPYWDATVNDLWDTSTVNWINTIGPAATAYSDGDPVLFDDSVDGDTQGAVVLNSTVTPASVTFDNSFVSYSITGTGAISGSTGLLKQGGGDLTLETANTYTGVTTLEGGVISVNLLANGGDPSSIGAASGGTANLVLAPTMPLTLNYTGGDTPEIDRGFSIAAADNTITSTLNLAADVTTSGQINATLGKLLKTGPGVLTLTGANANVLAVGSDGDAVPQALRLDEGGLVFDGAGQTNSVTGRTGFGSAGGFVTSVALRNGATFTGNGRTYVGLAGDSDTTLTVSDNSSMQLNDAFQISLSSTSEGTVIIEDSGSLTKTGGWLSIGNDGKGTMTVRDSGTLTSNGDFNVGDVGISSGFLNIEDSAVINSSGTVFIGKNGNGVPAESTSGTVTQTGGTFNCSNWLVIGRYNGSVGTVSVSGGSFNQTSAGQALRVGEEGNGTLTVSGTGAVTSVSPMTITNGTNSTGIVNLDGGSITAPRVFEDTGNGGLGNSTFNFNGGTLIAGTGAAVDFLNGLDLALVLPGGAFIDTNGNDINIGQTLSDGGGGLTKSGAGTLNLNAGNTYSGTTTVTAGSLGGTGGVEGPLVVNAGRRSLRATTGSEPSPRAPPRSRAPTTSNSTGSTVTSSPSSARSMSVPPP